MNKAHLRLSPRSRRRLSRNRRPYAREAIPRMLTHLAACTVRPFGLMSGCATLARVAGLARPMSVKRWFVLWSVTGRGFSLGFAFHIASPVPTCPKPAVCAVLRRLPDCQTNSSPTGQNRCECPWIAGLQRFATPRRTLARPKTTTSLSWYDLGTVASSLAREL